MLHALSFLVVAEHEQAHDEGVARVDVGEPEGDTVVVRKHQCCAKIVQRSGDTLYLLRAGVDLLHVLQLDAPFLGAYLDAEGIQATVQRGRASLELPGLGYDIHFLTFDHLLDKVLYNRLGLLPLLFGSHFADHFRHPIKVHTLAAAHLASSVLVAAFIPGMLVELRKLANLRDELVGLLCRAAAATRTGGT